MHIVLISEDYPPRTFRSGEGTYTRAFAEALRRLGHRVSVLTPAPDKPFVEEDHGVRIHWFQPWGWRVMGQRGLLVLRQAAAVQLLLRQIHKDDPIDVVEVAYPDAWVVFATLLATLPVVARGHGTVQHSLHLEGQPLRGRQLRLLCALDALALRSCDLVVAISDFMRDLYQNMDGLPEEKLATQPLPLSAPPGFLCRPGTDTSRRQRDSGVVFLYAGRLNWRKRPHTVVAAFARANVPGKRLLMVGEDSNTAPDGGSLRRYCLSLAEQLGVADQLEMVDHVPQEELLGYYQAAHVLVGPSLYETFGLAYVEAMAAGLPVIASTTGASPEIVTPESGILVPPDDVDALVAAMELLGTRPELRRSMGEVGRQLIRERYTPEQHAAAMLRWYELAIARHRERAAAPPAARLAAWLAAGRSVLSRSGPGTAADGR